MTALKHDAPTTPGTTTTKSVRPEWVTDEVLARLTDTGVP